VVERSARMNATIGQGGPGRDVPRGFSLASLLSVALSFFMKLRIAALASLTVLLPFSGFAGGTFDFDGEALRKVKLDTVRFRGWVPESDTPLRGTLVLIPGRHGDGRGMADNEAWQKLAREVGFAIVACQFSDGEPFPYQTDQSGEVPIAIDKAVETLGELSGRAELVKAPLAFWGTSAGSNVSAMYCLYNPSRVAAFASSKGTFGPGGDNNPRRDDIPMLFAIGQKDKTEWVEGSVGHVEAGIGRRAPWTLALHPTEGHGTGGSVALSQVFLKSAIEVRLGGANSRGLQRVSRTSGVLANPETMEIFPANQYRGNRSKAVWLPDEAAAEAWKNYMGGS